MNVNDLFVPPGHFYSPIPSMEELIRDEAKIYRSVEPNLPGIDMGAERQFKLLEKFKLHYNEMPFTDIPEQGRRYGFDNPAYSYGDGIFLYCMLREYKPKRLIEIGSGHSSGLIMDVSEKYFDSALKVSFIEPYPDLLLSLLKSEDEGRVQVVGERLQDVDLDLFCTLEAGDFLFIDSTHVSKIGSDVNRIIFEILPALNVGVFVHFHDIFYPFEYPKVWAMEGRAWNEAYILRAFLQNNVSWEIVLMNTYLSAFFGEYLLQHFPLSLKNVGASIWLKKIG